MTITERILAEHAGRDSVVPGEFVEARVDMVLANDITGPLAVEEFERSGARRVFDPEKIVLVPDHFTPCKDIQSAALVQRLRSFAQAHKVRFYEMGRVGIEHVLLPEEGLVMPGQLILGADSHTCTYGALGAFSTGVGSTDVAAAMITGTVWLKIPPTIRLVYSGVQMQPHVGGKDLILYTIGLIGVDGATYRAMEFSGEIIRRLPMDDRFAMCNMAVEAGAKNGIMEPDKVTLAFLQQTPGFTEEHVHLVLPDENAKYEKVIRIDAEKIPPQVAGPHLPANSRDVREYTDVRIDQAVIGSCTNGRISDLRKAASILKGNRVHPSVRAIVIPGSQKVYRQALQEGLLDIFLQAECVVSPPTCGPCLGGHMGILGKGEVAIATTNRNFIGRMGHPESLVYLSNPEVAAASAVRGRIVHPDEVLS